MQWHIPKTDITADAIIKAITLKHKATIKLNQDGSITIRS